VSAWTAQGGDEFGGEGQGGAGVNFDDGSTGQDDAQTGGWVSRGLLQHHLGEGGCVGRLMRMCEKYTGCRVLSYYLMFNHFHLLLKVPPMSEGGIL
jgi:hypothetical protein